jgi:hypothetical protein
MKRFYVNARIDKHGLVPSFEAYVWTADDDAPQVAIRAGYDVTLLGVKQATELRDWLTGALEELKAKD